MLDKDLALLFDIKPKRLREQVKRNIEKFPHHFMFQLSEEECNTLIQELAIPSKQHLGGGTPYVFSEHGVLQLSNIIKNPKATEMSIRIIEVFIKLRDVLLSSKTILEELEEIKQKIGEHDDRLDLVYDYLKEILASNQKNNLQRNKIGYKEA